MAKRKFKRVVAISDLHCGHRTGLTPPQWQLNPENEWDAKYAATQKEQWDWYVATITGLGPIDLLLVLGDCVDGASKRAEGRDSIRVMRRDQTEMAIVCLRKAKAKNIEMVYGTRYHVEDWEDDIAQRMDARIGAHGWPEVNGVVFDIKHKVGGSVTPYSRTTSIGRDEVWNLIWAEVGRQPRADIILRGHVHFHEPKEQRGRWIMTMPALQGVGTEYGAEQCSGMVDFGLLVFDVYEDKAVHWGKRIAVLSSHKAKTTKY